MCLIGEFALGLILGVDAIRPPLTGIGRYTWELAKHYSTGDFGFDDLRFFSAGKWISDPSLLLASTPKRTTRNRLRKILAAPASVRNWRLRRTMHRHLFHSPNYFLPELVDGGVVTIHDLSVFRYPETHPVERLRHFDRCFASTLNRASHIITDSEAMREEVASYIGWTKDRITAVHLGVPEEFRPYQSASHAQSLAQIELSQGEYTLCVSTLEPRKRIDRLLDAYRQLPIATRTRYQLVLAGSNGWLNQILREKIKRGEDEGWLRYVGFVPEVSLPALYAGARAFFFPSLYEGFGLPVLEALASGVPTLTSNCSSLPEVSGGAAWLVEPDDNDALRWGIEKVITDDNWRATAMKRGVEVARNMTWQKCARETVAVYESLNGINLRRRAG